jgi:sulfur carrier protein ThiS
MMAMRVHVKLLSRFREVLPPEARGEATIVLPEEATIEHLLEYLGLSKRVKLITVNGEREEDRGRRLAEGDSVRIFPVVVGG